MNTQLETRNPEPVTAVTRASPSALDMIQSVIDRGINSENVAALRELVALKRDMDADQAKREFVSAFIALQADIPNIRANKTIPDKHGGVRSTFATFEEIDHQAGPICERHGFVYSFSEGPAAAGKITKICTLMHKGGHERSNSYSVRIGQGPPGCTESQSDGAAHSYAKRGALCDALNIVVYGIDRDARQEGATISEELAFELERRVKETNSNVAMFLKFAGAAKFSEIKAGRYESLDDMLKKKEKQK